MENRKLIELKSVLLNEYSAVEIEKIACMDYLKGEELFLWGVKLCNVIDNFRLLSDSDLLSISLQRRKEVLRKRCSPYDNIIVIAYERYGERNCKIVNGRASKIFMLN